MEQIKLNSNNPPVGGDPATLKTPPTVQPLASQSTVATLSTSDPFQCVYDFFHGILECLKCFFLCTWAEKPEPNEDAWDYILGEHLESKLEYCFYQIKDHKQHVRELQLDRNTRYSLEELTQMVKDFPEARIVRLPKKINAELIKALHEHCPKIKYLDFSDVDSEGLDLDGITAQLIKFSELQGLNLSRKEGESLFEDKHFELFAGKLNNLRFLDLSGTINVAGSAIAQLVIANSHLEILILDGCGNLKTEDFEEIAAHTENLRALILNTVMCSCSYIPEEALRLFFTNNPHLSCLCLSDQREKVICSLLNEIRKLPLEMLDLSSTTPADKNCDYSQEARKNAELLLAVATEMPKLKLLILGHPHLKFDTQFGINPEERGTAVKLESAGVKLLYIGRSMENYVYVSKTLVKCDVLETFVKNVNRSKRRGLDGYHYRIIAPYISALRNKE
jgi:hypothetical protein